MARRDEMIYAMREADNRFVEAEKLTDYELELPYCSLFERSHIAAAELDRRDRASDKGEARPPPEPSLQPPARRLLRP